MFRSVKILEQGSRNMPVSNDQKLYKTPRPGEIKVKEMNYQSFKES